MMVLYNLDEDVYQEFQQTISWYVGEDVHVCLSLQNFP